MYYYPGHRSQKQFCTQSELSLLIGEQSGQSPARRAQCQLNHNTVRTLPGRYRVPHLTPGSRAAMWIKCLAEGQKCRATVGFGPGLSAWESSGLTTIPRHLHLNINLPFCYRNWKILWPWSPSVCPDHWPLQLADGSRISCIIKACVKYY